MLETRKAKMNGLIFPLALLLLAAAGQDDIPRPFERAPVIGEASPTFGVGRNYTCTTWLSSPENMREGSSGILGFWTGLNTHNQVIGRSLSDQDVIEEVKKACQVGAALEMAVQIARSNVMNSGR